MAVFLARRSGSTSRPDGLGDEDGWSRWPLVALDIQRRTVAY
jgi:hypothetical protein